MNLLQQKHLRVTFQVNHKETKQLKQRAIFRIFYLPTRHLQTDVKRKEALQMLKLSTCNTEL